MLRLPPRRLPPNQPNLRRCRVQILSAASMLFASSSTPTLVQFLAIFVTVDAFGTFPQPTLSSETSAAKQCSADAEPGSAQADAPYLASGGAYGARWKNWNGAITTCVPWLMPSNDKELAAILAYARAHNFTVRPGGATGSGFAAVTDGSDPNEIVVSLANYTAPSDWEYALHEPASDGGGATVHVNAGWSVLKLYSRIKPAGYTLPTQTALPIFQLGGMISNTVHGGIYTASFVSKYVKRLRVMAADGTIRLITADSELRMWRNSYGLLGIITAIEFELLPVSAFQVTFVERSFTWSESSFWEFVLSDAMAGLQPADLPPNVTAAGSQKAFSGQFFMDLSTLGAEQVRIGAIVALMNENATAAGVPSASPTTDAYDQLNAEVTEAPLQPDFSVQAPVFESLGRWGTPKAAGIPPALPASFLVPTILDEVKQLVADNVVNDGFLAILNKEGRGSLAINFVFSAYFVPISNLFAALDALRSDVLARSAANEDPGFVWNIPAEMRFVRVTDDAALNIVPPGMYGVVELLALGTAGARAAPDNQGWMKAFHAMETIFKQLGAVPHVAKEWGFEADSSGYVTKSAAASVCQIYSSATKQAFNSYRLQLDPEGRFAGGGAMGLLAACGVTA